MAQLQDPGIPMMDDPFQIIRQGLNDARVSERARAEMQAFQEARAAREDQKMALRSQVFTASALFDESRTPLRTGADRAVLGFTAAALLPGASQSSFSSPNALSSAVTNRMLAGEMPEEMMNISQSMLQDLATPDVDISDWFARETGGEMNSVSGTQLMHMAKTDGRYGELARRYLSTELTPEAKAAAAQLFTSPLMGEGQVIAFDDEGEILGGRRLAEHRRDQQEMVQLGFTPEQAAHAQKLRRAENDRVLQAAQAAQDRGVMPGFVTGGDKPTGFGVAQSETPEGEQRPTLTPASGAWTPAEHSAAWRVQNIASPGTSDTEKERLFHTLARLPAEYHNSVQTLQDIPAALDLFNVTEKMNPEFSPHVLRSALFSMTEGEKAPSVAAIREHVDFYAAQGDGVGRNTYLRFAEQFPSSPRAAAMATTLVKGDVVSEEFVKDIGQAGVEYLDSTTGRQFLKTVAGGGEQLLAGVENLEKLLSEFMPWDGLTSKDLETRRQAESAVRALTVTIGAYTDDGVFDLTEKGAARERLTSLGLGTFDLAAATEEFEETLAEPVVTPQEAATRALNLAGEVYSGYQNFTIPTVTTGQTVDEQTQQTRRRQIEGQKLGDDMLGGGGMSPVFETTQEILGTNETVTRFNRAAVDQEEMSQAVGSVISTLSAAKEFEGFRTELQRLVAADDQAGVRRLIDATSSQFLSSPGQHFVMREALTQLTQDLAVIKDFPTAMEMGSWLRTLGTSKFEDKAFGNTTVSWHDEQSVRVTTAEGTRVVPRETAVTSYTETAAQRFSLATERSGAVAPSAVNEAQTIRMMAQGLDADSIIRFNTSVGERFPVGAFKEFNEVQRSQIGRLMELNHRGVVDALLLIHKGDEQTGMKRLVDMQDARVKELQGLSGRISDARARKESFVTLSLPGKESVRMFRSAPGDHDGGTYEGAFWGGPEVERGISWLEGVGLAIGRKLGKPRQEGGRLQPQRTHVSKARTDIGKRQYGTYFLLSDEYNSTELWANQQLVLLGAGSQSGIQTFGQPSVAPETSSSTPAEEARTWTRDADRAEVMAALEANNIVPAGSRGASTDALVRVLNRNNVPMPESN